jgi:hypothetical protein
MAKLELLRQAADFLAQGDWQHAHAIAQEDESKTGCWVHGIVHVLEGDLDNAHYWYRRAGRPFPENFSLKNELSSLHEALVNLVDH